MTAPPNKVRVAAKTVSKPTAVFSTERPAKGDPNAPRREPPEVVRRRRIDLAHLQITGDDAVSLATAMKVVGMESSDESSLPDVRMPQSQAAPLDCLDGEEGVGPLPIAPPEGIANDLSAQVMAELHRDRGRNAAQSGPVGDGPESETRTAAKPRRDAASKAPPAGELDACLVRLIAVWPRLPQKIRDAIAAIVNSMEQS